MYGDGRTNREVGSCSDVQVTFSHEALHPYSNDANSAMKSEPSNQNGDRQQPATNVQEEIPTTKPSPTTSTQGKVPAVGSQFL